jgi:hypothetical protein
MSCWVVWSPAVSLNLLDGCSPTTENHHPPTRDRKTLMSAQHNFDRPSARCERVSRVLRRLFAASMVCALTVGSPVIANVHGQLLLPAGSNRMQVFEDDGVWTAPRHRVSHAFVLLCGPGGGGGEASLVQQYGGGGGPGGSVLTTIPVRGGGTYTITIGRGGEGAVGLGADGMPGGATTFAGPQGQILARADGGQGGTFDANQFARGGAGGEGVAHPDGGLVRRGRISTSTQGGELDQLCATFAPDSRGSGGFGAFYDFSQNANVPAKPGQDGWALVIW